MSLFSVGRPIFIPNRASVERDLPEMDETATDYPDASVPGASAAASNASPEREAAEAAREDADLARRVATQVALRVPQSVGLLDADLLVLLRGWHVGQWAWEDYEDHPLPDALARAVAAAGFRWVAERERVSAFRDYQQPERVRFARLLDLAVRHLVGVDGRADLMTAVAAAAGLVGAERAWWFADDTTS